MLRGSGERWSNRQWRSWMDLTSHLGVWSLSQEGKLLMDPDQSQGNIRRLLQCQEIFAGGLDCVVTVGEE